MASVALNRVINVVTWPIQKKENFIRTFLPIMVTSIAIKMLENTSYLYRS